jgi:hypothetical protein
VVDLLWQQNQGASDAVAVQSAVAQFWELLHEFTQYSKITQRSLARGADCCRMTHLSYIFQNAARQLHVNKAPRLIVDAG